MWCFENESLDGQQLQVNESLFTLANGYLGVRSCFEEGYEDGMASIRGTYINGLYDTVDVAYNEGAYGFPQTQDKQPNLMDSQTMVIYLDGERVSLFNGRHKNFKRRLFMDKGYSDRVFTYVTKAGKPAMINIRRMVSFVHRELFMIDVKVSYEGAIRIESTLNANVTNYIGEDDPRVGQRHGKLLSCYESELEEETLSILCRTLGSNIETACATWHEVTTEGLEKVFTSFEYGHLELAYMGHSHMHVTKYNVYTDGLRYKAPYEEAKALVRDLSKVPFAVFMEEQGAYLEAFWAASDVIVTGNDWIQESLRYNLYQLFQSVGRDEFSNISAKGLSGEGYEGHYFWDTEIYVMPCFQLNQGEITRQLLLYRYAHLEGARERARVLGHKRGVKFPWRTISGVESSTYFPAGTAQYHINGDVAYGFIQHYLQTGDDRFLMDYGAEVLFETARLWLDIGHFDQGQFRIDCVTGPDEYTAIVNNNFYTNCVAKYNLTWAAKSYWLLKEKHYDALANLSYRLKLKETEILEMQLAADEMYLPHDKIGGIDMQDDAFLCKKAWDFENTREDQYPLLLHFHPLTIYRHQVLKQADTVLAHFLLEDYTDRETIVNSYNYYEKITTHDSSLSSTIYGIMAAKLGDHDKAYRYFLESLRMDIDDTHGNTMHGLHMANMAGNVLSMVYGFAGLRIKEEGLSLDPLHPIEWNSLAFNINYKNRWINVSIGDEISLELIEGEPIAIKICGKVIYLEDQWQGEGW